MSLDHDCFHGHLQSLSNSESFRKLIHTGVCGQSKAFEDTMFQLVGGSCIPLRPVFYYHVYGGQVVSFSFQWIYYTLFGFCVRVRLAIMVTVFSLKQLQG